MTGNHYYIDLGGNKVTAHCYETDEWFEFKGEELFDWSISLPEGSILIGENAHFACPRSEKSKAQYFYAKERDLIIGKIWMKRSKPLKLLILMS